MACIAILLCLLMSYHASADTIEASVTCTSVVLDVAFIVDSSGSVGDYYQTEKDFVKAMATAFNITKDGTHAGVVIFSNIAEKSILLTDHEDTTSFNTAVQGIRFIKSGTRIDLGMKLAFELLSRSNGGRAGAERLMVLLTDGKQTAGEDPGNIGTRYRQLGINIVVIGIGDNLDRPQLTSIAGSSNFHVASSFDALVATKFINEMTTSSCSVVYRVTGDGRKYKFYNVSTAFDAAKASCEAEGAQLTIGDDTTTTEFLRQQYGHVLMWIGAKYDPITRRWSWVDGQGIDDSYWNGTIPHGEDICLTTDSTQPTLSCSNTLPYLCQKGVSTPAPPVLTLTNTSDDTNKLRFKCKFVRRNFTVAAAYEVSWYSSSGGSHHHIRNEIVSDDSDAAYLQNNDTLNSYTISTSIYCKVRTWYVRAADSKSAYATSNKYFAGVKIDSLTPTIYEGRSVQINVSLTVPVLCQTGSNNCIVSVELTSTSMLQFRPCRVEFHATRVVSTIVRTVTVTTKSDFVDDGQRTINVVPRVRTTNTSDDWINAGAQTIHVTRISVSTGRCTSTGDPHIRTFDGSFFDHYHVGYYTLVESTSRRFQVHVGYHKCRTVSCNCGVAVREGDDVLSVDMCSRKFSPQAYYRSNKEPKEGTFIERSANGKRFIMKFASGAFVRFTARPWSGTYYADITVQLPPADFNNTRGLCGLMDKNKANDLSDKEGVHRGHCGGNKGCASFTESWKLTREESLFSYQGRGIECLPTTNGTDAQCAAESGDARSTVTSGYKKMVSLAHAECRGVGPDVIVTEIPDKNPGPDKPTTDNTTTPVVPTFPTPSGVTSEDATTFCRTNIEGSAIYIACKAAIGVTFVSTGYIGQCVQDIQILDDKPVALQSAMLAIKSDCEEVVTRTNETDTTDVLDKMCPAECSGHGSCVRGNCICDAGYVSEDCSVNTDVIPDVEEFPNGRYCDVRTRKCLKTPVSALNLVPGRVVCGFNESMRLTGGGFTMIRSSSMLSFSEVICDLPTKNRVSSFKNYTSERHRRGIPSQTYMISLSNDRTRFSTAQLPFVVYDSKCMKCENLICTLKKNTCLINGYCFVKGEADPEDSQCKVCDPTRSTSWFVYNYAGINTCKGWYIHGNFMHMDLYRSPLFLIKDTSKEVISNKTVYAGIKGPHPGDNFKFVVKRCSAKSKNREITYTFFDQKCPLDPSFKLVNHGATHFYFQINPFTFQLRQSFSLHCDVKVCRVGDTSDECTQQCHKHPSPYQGNPFDVTTVSSNATCISHKECRDISCPKNSHCVALSSAECRCNEGYVYNFKDNTCDNERVLHVTGVDIEGTFFNSYSNKSSVEFLKYAIKMEKGLMTRLQKMGTQINGVKVTCARAGTGVVLDMSITYAKTVTSPMEATHAFISSVTSGIAGMKLLKWNSFCVL